MKEVEITTIKLKLGQKEVDLTVEEARSLVAKLNELFNTGTVKELVRDVHHYHDFPRYYWYYTNPWVPVLGFPSGEPKPDMGTTWCSNNVMVDGSTMTLTP